MTIKGILRTVVTIWALCVVVVIGAIAYHLSTDWYDVFIEFNHSAKVVIGSLIILAGIYIVPRALCRGDLS